MQAERPFLWPVSARGAYLGPKASHVTASHLSNMVCAIAADPISATVDTIRELRDLVPADVPRQASRDLLPGATFGEALDRLLDRLSTSEGRADFYTVAKEPMVVVRRHGERRTAEIRGFKSVGGRLVEVFWLFEPGQRDMTATPALAPVRYDITFTRHLLEACAGLVADSRAARAKASIKSSSGNPETKEGAPARAPSTHEPDPATPSPQRRRRIAQNSTDIEEGMRERDARQGASLGGDGAGSGSPHHPRSSAHNPPLAAVA
jgi:hypothetical protein